MSKLYLLFTFLILILLSCNKNNQQTLQPSNQTNNCDTVNCLGAQCQGTYEYYHSVNDTPMIGKRIRVTLVKINTVQYGSELKEQCVYSIKPINFISNKIIARTLKDSCLRYAGRLDQCIQFTSYKVACFKKISDQ